MYVQVCAHMVNVFLQLCRALGAVGGPAARFPSFSLPLSNGSVRRWEEMICLPHECHGALQGGAGRFCPLSLPISLLLICPLAQQRTILYHGDSPKGN